MVQRFETFAHLPPLSNAQIQAQAAHVINEGYVPSIEYAENPNSSDFYWQPWSLEGAIRRDAAGHAKPLTPEVLTAQIDACSHRHPYAFVRLTAYCPRLRNTALTFVAKTPLEGQVL